MKSKPLADQVAIVPGNRRAFAAALARAGFRVVIAALSALPPDVRRGFAAPSVPPWKVWATPWVFR